MKNSVTTVCSSLSRREAIRRAGVAAAGLALAGCQSVLPVRPFPKRVLFFSKSAGFEHPVIRRYDEDFSVAEKILIGLGGKYDVEFTCSKDGSLFVPNYLAKFDAFCFYTSGDLTTRGEDASPPMSLNGKAALLDAVASGKGFVGIHSAADTFRTRPRETNAGAAPAAAQNDGSATDPYIQMIGGEFLAHGEQQKAKLRVADPGFPGMKAEDMEFLEEWYSFKNLARDLHVLLIQETQGMAGRPYQRPPYPAAWVRLHGKGRVFYTSLGHREDVWTNPVFQKMLFGGISWAIHDANANVVPDVETVTPGYAELPPP